MKQNRFINGIAASTFGVLLINVNSDAMHTFLWGDLKKIQNSTPPHFL